MHIELQSGQVAQALGVSIRSLEHWVSQELVKPDLYHATRSDKGGKAHRYSFANLVEFGIVRELRGVGCSLTTILSLFENAESTHRKERWFGQLSAEPQWLVIRPFSQWNILTGSHLPLPENDKTLIVVNLRLLKQTLSEAVDIFL